MSVHHKIHDYFHNTPVLKTVNKKHYHPREGKYPRYYAYPLEDWQVVYQKITGLIRKFEGKTLEELYSYITNCYDYKNTPAFRQVWNSRNKEIFKDLCLSTKEEPYSLHSRINSAFYVDHSNKICVINNLKSERTNPKNDPFYKYRYMRLQFVEEVIEYGKIFKIYNSRNMYYITDSIDPLQRTFKYEDKKDRWYNLERNCRWRSERILSSPKHLQALTLEEARKIPFLCEKYNLYYTGK